MPDTSKRNLHAFVIPNNNKHAFGVVAGVIRNGYCSNDRLYVFYQKASYSKKQDVFSIATELENTFDIKEIEFIKTKEFKTINFVSLVPQTSLVLQKVLDLGVSLKRIWVHSTDDEINRWRLLHDRLLGRLWPMRRYKVSKLMIEQLQLLNNWHIELVPYGNHLERILKRPLNISGYNVYQPESEMPKVINDLNKSEDELTVAIGSKPCKKKFTSMRLLVLLVAILIAPRKQLVTKRVNLYVWEKAYSRFSEYLLRAFRIFASKVDVSIFLINQMTYSGYVKLFSRIDLLFKITRGGGIGVYATVLNGGFVIQPKVRGYRARLFNFLGNSSIKEMSLIDSIKFCNILVQGKLNSSEASEDSLSCYNNYSKKRDNFFKSYFS